MHSLTNPLTILPHCAPSEFLNRQLVLCQRSEHGMIYIHPAGPALAGHVASVRKRARRRVIMGDR